MISWGKFIVLGAVFLLCIVSGCQSDATDSGTSSTRKTQAVPASGQRYYHLTGSLDDLSITMELREEKELHRGDGRHFQGFYRYDSYGGPIGVYGTLTEDNQLVLEEQGSWEGNPHQFQGRWAEDGTYSGLWRHKDGRIVHDFRLTPNQDAIPLQGYWLEDSLVVYPQWPASPLVHHSVEWLDVPDGSMSEKQQAFLRREIMGGLLGEPTSPNNTQLLDEIRSNRQLIYADFREEMAAIRESGLIDSLSNPDLFASFEYDYHTSMQVFYNTTDLLTLGYTDYAYTGGAHGMYNTRVVTYDLLHQRVLKLTDVLLPGYVAAVSKALDRAVRIKYNLGRNTPLNTFLFEDNIAPNDNYGFTNKGVFFVYAPYEIAPYAAGEIELFVAFEQIQEYVTEGWLE